ncbi:MAG TPA: hypothetical protein VIX63_05485, partial [Vicinamibacterales bacterium]
TLVGEAERILEGEANAAVVAIRSQYGAHRKSGNLQESVQVEAVPPSRGQFGTAYVARVAARHAHLFELGTEFREYTGTDRLGRRFNRANRGRMWGRTPRVQIAIPTGDRHRHAAFELLKAMLRRHGFLVQG